MTAAISWLSIVLSPTVFFCYYHLILLLEMSENPSGRKKTSVWCLKGQKSEIFYSDNILFKTEMSVSVANTHLILINGHLCSYFFTVLQLYNLFKWYLYTKFCKNHFSTINFTFHEILYKLVFKTYITNRKRNMNQKKYVLFITFFFF